MNAGAETSVLWVEDRYTDNDDCLGRYIVEYNIETGIEHSTLCPSNTTRMLIPQEPTMVEVIDDTNGVIYKYDKGTFEIVSSLPQQSQIFGMVFAYNGSIIYYCNSESVLSFNENAYGETTESVRLLSSGKQLTYITATDKRVAICFMDLDEKGWTDKITEINPGDWTNDNINTIGLYPDESIYGRYVVPFKGKDYLIFSCIRENKERDAITLNIDRYNCNSTNYDKNTIDSICELPNLRVGGWSYTNSPDLLAALAQTKHYFGQELYYNAVILMDVNNGGYKTIRGFDYGPRQWVENSFVIIREQ